MKKVFYLLIITILSLWGVYSLRAQTTEETEFLLTFEQNRDFLDIEISASALPLEGGNITGTGFYNTDDVVNLLATPNAGYIFINWMENGIPFHFAPNYSFLATESRTLVANFAQETHEITVIPSPPEGGDVFGDGIYLHGTLAVIEAIPDTCYNFVNWTEDGEEVSKNPVFLFAVNRPRILTANFEPKPYIILTLALPQGGGTIVGGGNHDCGSTVTVTAVPNPGYSFAEWTENNAMVSTDNPYSFIAAEHRILTAHFVIDTLDITVMPSPPEGGDVSGEGSYLYGEIATVEATANECYTFVNWTEDDIPVSNTPAHSFTVIKTAILIANFVRKNYNIVTLENLNTGGETYGGGSYPCGDTARVWAEPFDGYEFVNWTENNISVCTDLLYKFEVTKQRVLVANFVPKTFEVTVSPNLPNGGDVTGSGTFTYGQTAVVKAFANPGYNFINWTKDGVPISPPAPFYAFIVTESCTLIANFEQIYYDITVSDNPLGSGNVTGSGTFTYGENATVNAIPNQTYNFINWTESGVPVSIIADYTFTVEKSRDLVANFERRTHEIILLANPPKGGTFTGGGIYNEGDTATIEVTANPCYDFVEWTESNNAIWFNPVYKFVVTESRTLTANFETKLYDIILSEKPLGSGGVSGGGTDIPCGDTITITAMPALCYDFVNWTENSIPVSTETDYTFVVAEHRDLTANFKTKVCNVFLSANPPEGGMIFGSATGIICGDTIIVTATPAECYEFVNWTEDGITVSSNADYKFTVTESRDLVANFEKKTYAITLLANPQAGCIFAGDGYQPCGEQITVTAITNPCYIFLNWTEDDVVIANTVDYTFTVTEPRTLVANFEQKTYDLALYAYPPEGGTVTGSGKQPCGDEITVTATPNFGYEFVNWTENGNVVSTIPDYTFTETKSCILVANFTLKAYEITVLANPLESGAVSGSGMYNYADLVTVTANASNDYEFINWTENNMVVSTDTAYSFTVTKSCTLVANFDKLLYEVIADVNDETYGNTSGSGMYSAGDTVRIEAIVNSCYIFANWTINDKVVSSAPIYEFVVKEDVLVVANFYALDFDTYSPTLWNNTFMLNMKKLKADGYTVIGCRWFKNDDEEIDTHTIDRFSYSAGPNITDLLESAPTWYRFELITENHGTLCSTIKMFDDNSISSTQGELVIYPNPVTLDNSFIVEGVVEGCTVDIYNQYGICVSSVVAKGNSITITLNNVQTGMYLIRTNGKQGKVVIVR